MGMQKANAAETCDFVELIPVRSCTLTPLEEVCGFGVDGEVRTPEPISLEIVPSSLQVMAPFFDVPELDYEYP